MAMYDGTWGDDELRGGDEDDHFFGWAGDDLILGGAGRDTAIFRGYYRDYVITWDAAARSYTILDAVGGRDGRDRVSGVEQFNFMDGMRTIADLLPGQGDGLVLTGTPGWDYLAGGEGYDTLMGLGGDDMLDGMLADDVLDGGDGNDHFRGDAGNDQIIGGAGWDRAMYSGAFRDYFVTYDAALDRYMVIDSVADRDGIDTGWGVEDFGFMDRVVGAQQLVMPPSPGQTLLGTEGWDFLMGQDGDDTLRGLGSDDNLDGMGGNDELEGGAGNDGLRGGAGHDRLLGGEGEWDRAFFAGQYADYRISWNAETRQYILVDRVAGRDGIDIVSGVEQFSFMDGTRSIADLVPGEGDGMVLTGTPGWDFLMGGEGYDRLSGLDGDDMLEGMGANDVLEGGAGNDGLRGGAGHDRLVGGDGQWDRAMFSGSYGDYRISWDAVSRMYTVADQIGGRDGVDTVSGVEHFQFQDATRTIADLVPGEGDGVLLTGTEGWDYLTGGDGYDVITGLGGDDVLDGMWAGDRLDGGDGNDLLRGGAGNDQLAGGAGQWDRAVFSGYFSDYDFRWDSEARQYVVTDRTWGRDGVDRVSGVEFFEFVDGLRTVADLVPGQGDGVLLRGTEGSDFLTGGEGFDMIEGLGGDDLLEGLGADDVLDGGDGNDLLRGGQGNDRIDGGAGERDAAVYSRYFAEYAISYDASTQQWTIVHQSSGDGTDMVTGVEEFHFMDGIRWVDQLLGRNLVGTAGDDLLQGGGGDDSLDGLAGNDTLHGEAGRDTLRGGDGNDMLRGGDGIDYLFGGAGDDQLEGGDDIDEIDGGDGTDTVVYAQAGQRVEVFLRDGYARFDPPFADALYGIENVVGSQWADTLVGLFGIGTLRGGEGDDSISDGAEIYGEGGNDRMSGAARMDGGAGTDTAAYLGALQDFALTYDATLGAHLVHRRGAETASDRLVSVEAVSFSVASGGTTHAIGQVIQANAATVGNDVLNGTAGADTIVGFEGNDTINGSGGNDELEGASGNDSLYGGAGNDLLVGGGGDDALDGGAGGDRLVGGSGVDSASYVASASAVTVDLVAGTATNAAEQDELSGIEAIVGSNYNDTLIAGAAAVRFSGGAGHDVLRGGVGNDNLIGGAGNDTLEGGDGEDTASYAGNASAVRVNLALAGSQNTSGAGTDTLTGIENLVGGNGNDTLTGNDFNNRLEGGTGGDTLTGGRGADVLVGGAGSDSYFVDDSLDTLVELAGEGTDLVFNSVNWTLGEHFENLTVSGVMGVSGTGNALANVMHGNSGGNLLSGLEGNDTINGAGGNDTLLGGDGDDALNGGSGIDQMEGGAGNDTYLVDDSSDKVIEAVGGGYDVVSASWSFTLGAEVEKLVLTGLSNISGTGSGTANELVGNGGANTLSGGGGADVLDGALGADTLTGGTGADVFRFSSALNGSVDRITDLVVADDTIWLDNAVFTALVDGALAVSALQIGTWNTANSAEVRIIFNSTTGALFYDADGTGAANAVQFATVSLAGLVGQVTNADFLVI